MQEFFKGSGTFEETLEILEDDISFDEAFHVKHLLGQI